MDGHQTVNGATEFIEAEFIAAEIVLVLCGFPEALAGVLPDVHQGDLKQETKECLDGLDSTLDLFQAESSNLSSELNH